MMNVSKHESGVIPNGGKDSMDSLYAVFIVIQNLILITDEGNFIVFFI